MAGVRVAKSPRRTVVDGDKKRRKAVVACVAHEMFVQPSNELRGADGFTALRERLTSQRSLQAGHEQRGRNPFARNVRNGNGHMRWTELNEIVVVAAHRARCFANRFDLDSRN